MGELKPGDRPPPDRVLAEQLGVDRTSLRAALNELASRNIVRAVQGSGVVVLDYREHAGLDFLDAVFGMPDIELGSAFNLELLDHWIEVVPGDSEAGAAGGRHLPTLRPWTSFSSGSSSAMKKGASTTGNWPSSRWRYKT
ncbi:MAG: GntR family transcriptional regulator [Desulfosudis oleivorans]|nr:GntR family transcriptional regulator [Desulfosudis oleivorans]